MADKTTVYIPEDLKKEVKIKCVIDNVSMQKVINDLLEKWVKK